MAKFALECPHCGTVNRASTFIFAKKVITCGNCKNDINVKENRIAIGTCEQCGNVAFDQAKGVCPVCKNKIKVATSAKATTLDDLKKDGVTPLFLCPECGCNIQASKQQGSLLCPVCDHVFEGYEDIFKQIQKSKLVSDNGVSVIKYEGDNQTFVWKHPIEDFNTGSQLLVHESQEAIFFLNGQALDLFGPGKYTLETESMPVLKKVYDLPTGNQNPFHAEVYFINKTVQMSIKWGTDSRVRFIEPNTGLPLDIGASGELNLQVSDSRKLLVKLVGTMGGIAYDGDGKNFSQSLRNCFRPLISTTVKSNLAAEIKNEKINILEIDERLELLSVALGRKISAGFEEYGLTVPQFYVTNVALPEDDPNFKKIRSLISAAYFGVREKEVETDIEIARRKKVLEQQATDIELAKREQEMQLELAKIEAEKKRVEAQGEAAATMLTGSAEVELERQRGMNEAEIMRAKGYTEKDVLQADVQKAYAEGIGQIGSNAGGGSGGGMVSDILGLGVGIAAMGAVGDKVGGVMKDFNSQLASDGTNAAVTGWKCSCGCEDNRGKFCSECGKEKPELWDCPHCGAKDNKGKFCSECGKEKPELWDCPHCGAKKNKGKFCSECGKTKDSEKDTWDCTCGNKGITGKFCSECGKTRPVQQDTWDCECGNKGITGKFCSECGNKKEVDE